MATILLSAVGASVGSAIGGSVFGLTSAVIGRAVGATVGRVIDQSILGAGSGSVEVGRIERFRLTGAGEGDAIPISWGAYRMAGQIIWASRFLENSTTTGGGKGAPRGPKTTTYSYSVSLAVALCEGEITRVARVWADGVEIPRDDFNLRVYAGSEDQLPDPKIEAVEGEGLAPAYRGLAYVVFEDLDLTPFGNRVPQFNFEVVRPAQGPERDGTPHVALSRKIKAVAMIPGTGEYALATTPVHFEQGLGENTSFNVNTPAGKSDFAVSLEALDEELENCASGLMVVSWFGDDLRCGDCTIRPKVEQNTNDGVPMPWAVAGLTRGDAELMPQTPDNRPIYGGTPADAAVIEAIVAMRETGKDVVFYPFILMDQIAGNALPDPYSDAETQPVMPWRGRITTSQAPNRPGSPDGTGVADAEVEAFFGTASASDFTVADGVVIYSGPDEWSMRRFILHNAALCAAAGGVAAFCIGSEMRALTQIRGAGGSFPTVAQFRALAAEVRALVGPDCKISYAADWSEYFGYQPQDGSGDVYFHLDPLWSDPNIDFVGIDNYMPLTDWRDGLDHADADWGAIYDLGYLSSNIEGGEGFDWYYRNAAERSAQVRTPITDGAHGEAWIYRYKDLRSWWRLPHHERINGVRQEIPTSWVPQGKPIWFTEVGCASLDKATNQPNKFIDLLSSESAFPYFSNGRRDDLIQARYLHALLDYWDDPARNPVSEIYGAPMIDTGRTHVWAWDTRPWPAFPNNLDLWVDGQSYARGHWLNGRVSAQDLGAVVAEVCARNGLTEIETKRLYGLVRGYAQEQILTGRGIIQPLVLAHGIDAAELGGDLTFSSRRAAYPEILDPAGLAVIEESPEGMGDVIRARAPDAEIAGKVRVNYVDGRSDFEIRAAEAIFPGEVARGSTQSDLPMSLLPEEGQAMAERWLAEARTSRDSVRLAVPPSQANVEPGQLVQVAGDDAVYRVDAVDERAARVLDAVRVENAHYTASDEAFAAAAVRAFAAPVPVFSTFLDLPLLSGDEIPHAPHVAVTARPWPGSVAVFSSPMDSDYGLERLIPRPSIIGVTETPLAAATPGLIDRGGALRVRLTGLGTLASVTEDAMLRGANLAAIGDGTPGGWEVFQFAEVDPVTPGVYDLRIRLRGQAGSEVEMRASWPSGSYFVLLTPDLIQLDYPPTARGLVRHYRIGPAKRPYDDSSYTHADHAFEGRGLRPYAPCHLRGARAANGDWAFRWVRRTRTDGDRWDLPEVPLGEAVEQYTVRVRNPQDAVVREVSVQDPNWIYDASMQSGDGSSGGFALEVAQNSDRYGPGPFERIEIDG